MAKGTKRRSTNELSKFPQESIPVGAIIPFGGPISAIPDGFLPCQGAEVNRNTYAGLFSVIGNNWGEGNGTTTFNLPTTNGNLLRGRAAGSASDPDRDTRTAVLAGGAIGDNVGSLQTWRVQSHQHRSLVTNSIGITAGGQNAGPTDVNGFNTNANQYNNTGFNNVIANRFLHLARTNLGAANTVGNVGALLGGGNGNVNLGDTSPNSQIEYLSRTLSINTTSTGSNQTVGQNVYVEFIIKF